MVLGSESEKEIFSFNLNGSIGNDAAGNAEPAGSLKYLQSTSL